MKNQGLKKLSTVSGRDRLPKPTFVQQAQGFLADPLIPNEALPAVFAPIRSGLVARAERDLASNPESAIQNVLVHRVIVCDDFA
jgi:hypothetical protein